jgi:parallel beta-helix repeat protein
VLAVLLACAGMAAGATWVVDDDGGAGVNYTTIQDAVNASSDGDTIEVRSGTYVENVNVPKRLTLIGDGADVVTVRAEVATDRVFKVSADYVNISGFTVTRGQSGIYLGGADYCSISNNNASGNDYGIYLDSSNNNTLTSNDALDNWYGIHIDSSSNNTLTNNTASGNDDGIGIYLHGSSNNTLTNNNASNNDYSIGIYLDSSSNNTLSSNNASDNTWDLYIENSESTFRDNTLNGTTISFTYGGDVSLKGVGSPADDPAGWNTIGKFISATNQSAGAWIFLNFSYSGSGLSGLDESSLKVWKHNGTTWIEDGWNGTRYLDIEGNVIGVNITTFSVFAPAALAAAAGINCTGDICVNQTGWWRDGGVFNASETPIQAAIDSATDGDIICVWNGSYSENVNVNKRLTLQGESADVVTVRAEDGSDHVFEVTADCVNISGFTVTGAGATGWSTAGIYLDSADHCNISDNNASDNCKGIHLYSSGSNNLTNNTANSNYHGEWSSGIYLDSSNNNTLSSNNASNNGYSGIYLYSSGSNNLTNNTANSNYHGDWSGGIYLDFSNNNKLTNNTASNNGYSGIYLYSSSDNNTLTSNTASGNVYGIHLDSSSNNTLTSNNASGNVYGIKLYYSINNALTNNIASNNDYGIYLDSSNNNTLTNSNASDNTWDLYIKSSESAFRDNTLNGTTISFTYNGDVSLKGVGSPASDPDGWNTIGKFIRATNQSAGASIFLNFSYSGSDLSGLDESSLKVWKHNGTAWIEDGWNGTRYLDIEDNIIGVNITSFSVFAPAALAAAAYIPPDPAGLANTTGRYWVNYTWSAGTGNVTDSYNVSMNETWTNGTTETFMNVSVGPGGWANIAVFAYNASGTGMLSLESISDNVQAPGALSAPPEINCTCGNICVNQTGWWRDNGAFNASGTPIQAAIDSATDGDTICVWNGSYNENVDVNKRLTIRSENDSTSTVVHAANSSVPVFEVTADYVNISGFTVKGATLNAGVYLGSNVDHCNLSGNNITNNSEGVHIAPDASGNVINFNNIAGNSLCGINNTNVTEMVNATCNWWGDVSGPSEAGNGTGDVISVNVDYAPWLDSPYPEGEPIYFTNVTANTTGTGTTEIDALEVADTGVTINTTAPVNVTIGNYSRNPGAVFDGDIGKYIDVHVNDTTNVSEIEIRLYYTDSEIQGLDESSLRMYWWNNSAWVDCSASGVNTTNVGNYSGYVRVNISSNTIPRLSEFNGSSLASGGRTGPPPSLAQRSRGGGTYPVLIPTPAPTSPITATPTPVASPTPAASPVVTPTPSPSPTQTSSFPTNPLPAVPSEIIAAILASVIFIAAVYLVLRRKAR